MLRSMYSGISGMKNFQTKLDVIGNNIANVNTVGFKKGRVTFQDMMSQTTSGAQGPTANRGGINPYQVGLGAQLGSIDNIHTQGFGQTTYRPLDLALEGDGMFVVAGNTGRNPNYSALIQDAEEEFADIMPGLLETLELAEQALADAKEAGNPDLTNEEADVAAAKEAIVAAQQALDDARSWDVNLQTSSVSYTRAGAFYLDADGALVNPDGLYLVGFQKNADNTFDTANHSTIIIPKDAKDFSIQTDGTVNYIDAMGNPQVAGQIILANFSNASGLQKAGNNLFIESPNSGIPVYTVAETDGTASMVAGALEMSNVDLAEEFTEMIVSQRGFQANTRIISTSDEILQELVNLKR